MDELDFMQFKDQKDFFEKEGNDNWIYLYKSIKRKYEYWLWNKGHNPRR